MSFALPSVKPRTTVPDSFSIQEDSFGGHDLMRHGLSSIKQNTQESHPLASQIKNEENKYKMNMTVLRNIQGIHAPLRIAVEMKAAKKIGRLPFLPSSNIMHDVLTGNDFDIGPKDVFNTSEFMELSGQPHAVMEKSLGIL
ncbi:unnamed protein product [Phyllotreta striolata]|uniref:Proteasome maturation protein n=1 Tax=Phyllotreta striolata TaxID=444603 RepID=A0A9P0DQE0_PHYSR|nr:unnamed protein product [Phyllotreta striolata]